MARETKAQREARERNRRGYAILRGDRCKNCGALKMDHIDYNRGYLVCPRVEGGRFEREDA